MITDVFLLGHMRILQEAVLASGPRFFNLHPSLLPSFPGLKSLERAFAAQAPLGCTIHKVVPEVDAGQALLQLPLGAGGRAYLETDLQMAALALHAAESRALRRFCRRPRGAD
jgi:folate-dependent phosphoribosylglycinamide formyltransferase PurN